MNIGQRIKEKRKSMGLTVDEVAKKLNKNRATVYRYESNDIENLPISILEPLAEILQTTPSYLMGWEDNELNSYENLNKSKKLKELILSRYNSIREFSKIVGIPNSTLTSALDKSIGGMAVDRIIKICDVLNIDVKTFEPLENVSSNTNNYSEEEQNHIEDLRKLNDIGKNKVITYTKDLIDNPKFINEPIQKQSENEISATSIDDFEPYLLAAHSDGLDEETNKANIEKIKEMYLKIKGK
ncbi:helix-turn-helix domain-containing protein [Clostridium perfringens]|uniref:Helix-turn-helix domain-containing protein n=2 Tax=Clostridium perfringens TaxID=1502 RepID=A0AAP7BWB3_CLOPF|nr:helix-turn-helix transcriptional regulator [Clostridium perfringens]NP_612853.1 helix-turn-helix domain-containing protein [Clostridium phage phi3626]AAL96794.1 putative CI-like transcriptional repressor [Clostridium phage phi3626]EDT22579.1 helix-turn-helix domain protein [Clostridium perfringens B str. ATCC 3626]NGU30639.1 helix-turn-helix domain-containing protein [Clostridium perfringens]WEV05052.1 helix-turn-helix domain-containing protein [Clostridium perfringens B]